ncbi:DUF349 domain-containing protein [Arenibacter sp. GZD96]|uniref:DUF349 domain-containing protein n=1 Tax=Aurantibrevibacter litoralis TaxID=3106030 RepID=UPI002AFE702F|nr:DUF349 domain-containing protein [Arenibacter sp. GZD-96]MEA1785103.1 DUF349 domain-containing protein [Arenibacter sp. GZD-96]
MLEEKEDKPQEKAVTEESVQTKDATQPIEKKEQDQVVDNATSSSKIVDVESDSNAYSNTPPTDSSLETQSDSAHSAASDTNPTLAATPENHEKEIEENGLNEIEDSNAEDAEDEDNQHRHRIPVLDYHAMPMCNLVGELQRLVKNEKIQAIKKHVEDIKSEFDLKFQDFLEQKKEEFIASGGNEIDFKYNSVDKRQFNEVYAEYREKRNQYHRNLEQSLKSNLSNRLALIEELKSLINVEEDINTTYKSFKTIQEKWRSAGPIPRNNYNDVWRTYHHHVEIFYDFLHLNRELRDLDFKHNLEEKEKIVLRAEALATEEDLSKAFRELQTLHKIWKEDIGPVDQEHREAIWQRFSKATRVLHLRKQEEVKELEKVFEQNLEKKREIINAIEAIATHVANDHKTLQQQIKKVEALREQFFNAGKVPQKVNEKTWKSFKEAIRAFNHKKNAFYKNLKKDQQDNLEQKQALVQLALSLKDSEDFSSATPEMKRIQDEWKKIGHVPRKYSDKIWKEFKSACNHYFNRLHATKNESQKEESDNYERKNACLEKLKAFAPSGDTKKDIAELKTIINAWKSLGRVPFHQKNINSKFDTILDGIFKKLKVGKQEAELLKYGNKIQQLAQKEDGNSIANERHFIRKKIDESKAEIRQLENNLQFFANASTDSPIVQEVIKNIENHKEALDTWKAKLKKLNILENDLIRASDEEATTEKNDETS